MEGADLLSDERLVGRTLEGDREAFGQIVARYQSPICALAYSAFGSITRSEDVAQEVFVAAWRRLRELKDPSKLKSWLYAIARNLICTTFRQQSRNPLAAAAPLDEALDRDIEFQGPSDSVMSKEEAAILWHVLSGLPEIYREPMVLFYRQEESVSSVAELLGISEEAVRQRLSRGRAMPNERVAKVVEIGLRRSGPTRRFELAVLAALPPAGLKAGAVEAATIFGKSAHTLARAALGALSTVVSIIASAGSAVAGLVGLWGRVQSARSLRERRFVSRTVWGTLAWGLAFIVVGRLLVRQGVLRMSTEPFDVIACTVYWLAGVGPLCFYSIWRARGQRRIQLDEGTVPAMTSWWMWSFDASQPGFRTTTKGMLACLFFGASSWLILGAMGRGDLVMGTMLLALSFIGWGVSSAAVMRQPEKTASVFVKVWWALAAFILAVVNVRWGAWFGGGSVLRASAPWTIDYVILFIFGMGRLAWWLKSRILPLPDARRAMRLAIAGWGVLLVSGMIVLALIK